MKYYEMLLVGKCLLKYSPESEFSICSFNNEIEAVYCIIKEAVVGYLQSPIPLLFVDGCFAGNKTKVLGASYIDANHCIQNIGIYICGEDNINHYVLFFTKLLQAGIKEKENVVLMTDNGNFFAKAVELTFKEYKKEGFQWCLCYEHYKRNLAYFIENEFVAVSREERQSIIKFCENNLFFATRSPTKDICDRYLSCIENRYPTVKGYIDSWGYELYRYNFESAHFSQFSNNVAESLNSMLLRPISNNKSVRESPIHNIFLRFIMLTYKRMEVRLKILDLHEENQEDYVPSPTFGHWVTKRVIQLGYTYTVFKSMYKVHVQDNTVEDAFWEMDFQVDLGNKTCTCGYAEQDKYPCIHIIALLHERKEFYRVAEFIDDCYKRESIKNSCSRCDNWTSILHDFYQYEKPNVEQYNHLRFSFWYAVTSIKRRIPSRGEEVLNGYHSFQGKKLRSNAQMNK